MMARLREYGLLTTSDPSVREVVEALHRYVARARPPHGGSLALVDAVGDRRPRTCPAPAASTRESWCVPLCDAEGSEIHVEDLPGDVRFDALLDIMEQDVR